MKENHSGERELYDAMREFSIRALSGKSTPQETAVLPSILALLLNKNQTASDN